MTDSGHQWRTDIARRFARGFSPVAPEERTIGREAEFPVVDSDGRIGDVQRILTEVLERNTGFEGRWEDDLIVEVRGPNFALAAEVGIGTVELITGPRPRLGSLEQDHLDGLSVLREAACRTEQYLLGLGIQPRSPARFENMCPKGRYEVLSKKMGSPWLWFTLTASDQVHVDIGLDELAAVTNTCSLLTPVTVALCGNSGIMDGKPAPACSSREYLMGEIYAARHRHGMPAGPIADLHELIDQLVVHEHLMHKLDGVPVAGKENFERFATTIDDPTIRFREFLFHEHYVWNSARPRSAQGTLELRSACQQPFSEHMVATALGLAMVEAHRELDSLLADALGTQPWTRARQWHAESIVSGLNAEEPEPGFITEVLRLCQRALERRGHDEAHYLGPLFERLNRRENPAQASRARWAESGIEAVLETARAH